MGRRAQRERLAEYAHEAWSGWMHYLFSRCGTTEDGGMHIPPKWVRRWQRQVSLPYELLREDEKDSDRREADRMLEIVRGK
jgi:hypothetical protein